MKNLLLALALIGIVGCSTGPRLDVGDRVNTPAGHGTIIKVQKVYAFTVEVDELKDEEGNKIQGTWEETEEKPFTGVQKLGK